MSNLVESVRQAVEQAKKVDPTWEVELYDKEEALRLDWFRAPTEEEAKKECKKTHKGCVIVYAKKSDRSLEEIEALS